MNKWGFLKLLIFGYARLCCCSEQGLGYSSLWCTGFSLQWLLQLQNTGSRHLRFSSCNLRALECGLSSYVDTLSCSMACGIFPDQGSNPCIGRQMLIHCTTREVQECGLSPPPLWCFPSLCAGLCPVASPFSGRPLGVSPWTFSPQPRMLRVPPTPTPHTDSLLSRCLNSAGADHASAAQREALS